MRTLRKPRMRRDRGEYVCSRCDTRFGSRDAFDRHIVVYTDSREGPYDWCHLPEEVGLVAHGGRWVLPAGPLTADLPPGGVPSFPRTRPVEQLDLSEEFEP